MCRGVKFCEELSSKWRCADKWIYQCRMQTVITSTLFDIYPHIGYIGIYNHIRSTCQLPPVRVTSVVRQLLSDLQYSETDTAELTKRTDLQQPKYHFVVPLYSCNFIRKQKRNKLAQCADNLVQLVAKFSTITWLGTKGFIKVRGTSRSFPYLI